MRRYPAYTNAFAVLVTSFTLLHVVADIAEAVCDSKWHEFEGQCYYISSTDNTAPSGGQTWRQSRDWCLASGGDLVTVTSVEERRWLNNLTEGGQYFGALWIGLNSLPYGTEYRWADGNQAEYRDWEEGEPKLESNAYCVAQLTHRPSRCFTHQVGNNVVASLFPTVPRSPLAGGIYFAYLMGKSDEDGTAECLSRCADNSACTAFTFLSNFHPSPTWKGECLGRSDGNTEISPDDYGFSGVRYQCGNDQGIWITVNCGEKLGFVCRKTSSGPTFTTVPPTTPTPGYCPTGYFPASPEGGNKCFRVVHVSAEADDSVNWNNARQICRSGPGLAPDLAVVQSILETATLTTHITDYAWGYWIGLRRSTRDSSAWVWSDNSDLEYTNWAANKPFGTGQCTELWTFPGPTGTWNNQDCTYRRGYVCQTYKDPNEPILTPPITETSWCSNAMYRPYGRACYYVISTAMTWSSAKSACQQQDADLATINSESENAAVFLMGNRMAPLWIGIKKDADQEWEWTDKWPVVYTKWNTLNGPDPSTSCGSMGTDGLWKNDDCNERHAAMCKKSLDPVPTIPPTPIDSELACPTGTGWEEYARFCYYVSTSSDTTGNWATASAACRTKGGLSHDSRLASIHHAAENQYIYNRLKANNRQQAWIGLKKQGYGYPFEWEDGSVAQYFPWAPTEPNDADGSQLCVEMYVSLWPGLWNDHLCGESLFSRGYVCKAAKELKQVTPTALPGFTCPTACHWHSYGSYCYFIEPNIRMSWDDAQVNCIERGGSTATLATIGDRHTEIYLMEAFQKEVPTGSRVGFWIGLVRKNQSLPFQWIDGSPVNVTYWEPGEPNNQNGEHCTEMFSSNGLWNDRDCSHLLNYVCQVRKENLGLTQVPPSSDSESVLKYRSGRRRLLLMIVAADLLMHWMRNLFYSVGG